MTMHTTGGTGLDGSLTRYLGLAAKQMALTAGNMANVDTPGYKTLGFDFDQAFADALRGGGAEPAAGEVDGLVARPDGNNVSMEREGLALAKAQLEFRTGTELLKHEFSRMLSAIHAESR